ncbi:hypothetical protein [Rickettsiella endosymbiont of Rhagonycha lignosa]|uniref:hypothetical protein n=1 Tax=Rickettsiella endosymbiont of Rhagonycha lignosa TaxID=3077937 RepID=UPI00313E4C7B
MQTKKIKLGDVKRLESIAEERYSAELKKLYAQVDQLRSQPFSVGNASSVANSSLDNAKKLAEQAKTLYYSCAEDLGLNHADAGEAYKSLMDLLKKNAAGLRWFLANNPAFGTIEYNQLMPGVGSVTSEFEYVAPTFITKFVDSGIWLPPLVILSIVILSVAITSLAAPVLLIPTTIGAAATAITFFSCKKTYYDQEVKLIQILAR